MPDLSHRPTTTIQIETVQVNAVEVNHDAPQVSLTAKAATISIELEPIE